MQTKDVIVAYLTLQDYATEKEVRIFCAGRAEDYSPGVFDAELTTLLDTDEIYYSSVEGAFRLGLMSNNLFSVGHCFCRKDVI